MTSGVKQTLLTAALAVGCVGMVMDVRPAAAVSLTWTLSGVTFIDGTTAVGSFDYDADTNTYSNINITVDNPIPANGVPGFPFPTFYDATDLTDGGNFFLFLGPGSRFFSLNFSNLLTNSGGTFGFNTLYGSVDSGVQNSTGIISTLAPTPVPAPPGVLGLLLSGALTAYKARKSQRPAALAQKTTV